MRLRERRAGVLWAEMRAYQRIFCREHRETALRRACASRVCLMRTVTRLNAAAAACVRCSGPPKHLCGTYVEAGGTASGGVVDQPTGMKRARTLSRGSHGRHPCRPDNDLLLLPFEPALDAIQRLMDRQLIENPSPVQCCANGPRGADGQQHRPESAHVNC